MPSPPPYAPALFLHRLYSSAWPDRDGICELRRHGVDVDLMTDLCGPVVRTLATFDAGLFVPDPMGEAAFVVPVTDEAGERHVDVVGWSARSPKTFGTLLRNAGLLGTPCAQTWIRESPLAWLQHSCGGIVILDAEKARHDLSASSATFVVSSVKMGERLVAACGVLPARILVDLPEAA